MNDWSCVGAAIMRASLGRSNAHQGVEVASPSMTHSHPRHQERKLAWRLSTAPEHQLILSFYFWEVIMGSSLAWIVMIE